MLEIECVMHQIIHKKTPKKNDLKDRGINDPTFVITVHKGLYNYSHSRLYQMF